MDEENRPGEEEIKEVYARFGLAYYESEVLHRGLCNYYSLLPFRSEGDVSRLRIEERLDHAWSTTLGQMVRKLSASDHLAELDDRLHEAVERRNSLAHEFWFDNVHKLWTRSGVEGLLRELDEAVELFCALNELIEERTRSVGQRLGISDEVLEKAMEEILAGEDQQPLHDQRKPNKQERIVAAYAVPHPEGHQLVFESRDGNLWQLSDVGLAWTTHEEVFDDWKEVGRLKPYLPATINPRPQIEAPYVYSISLAGSGVLRVDKKREGKTWWVEEQ